MKNNHATHLLQLLVASLFVSTSGALGKYIELPTPVVIWWRSFLGAIFLFLFCYYKKYNLHLKSKKDITTIVCSALLFGGHWISYFLALKLSNVAIGMLSLFTYPIFTALLEPLFIKVKFDPAYILLGLIVLLGVYILAPKFDLESNYTQGILFGFVSAICLAIRNILSKKLTIHYNGTTIMLYQITILTLVLMPFLFTLKSTGFISQFPYVIILALITTAIGHTMLVNSLKYFSASTTSIVNSIQPVFGIIIACIFLNEIPSTNTYIGGTLILSTVIIESFRTSRK